MKYFLEFLGIRSYRKILHRYSCYNLFENVKQEIQNLSVGDSIYMMVLRQAKVIELSEKINP